MDTRQTPAERAAAEKAVKDEAAQASAMRQAAVIQARDAKATSPTIEGREAGTAAAVATRKAAAVEAAKRRPALVGPLTARLAVENAALEIEERAALALEEAEAEVGNDDLWFILTHVFKPDSLTRLLAQCRAAVAKFDAAAEAEKAAAKTEPAKPAAKVVIPDDETAEARRIREGHEADAKRLAATPARASVTKRSATGDRVYDRVMGESVDVDADHVADPAEGTLNRYLAQAIVQATKSDNRP